MKNFSPIVRVWEKQFHWHLIISLVNFLDNLKRTLFTLYHFQCIHSEEGLMLETSALKLLTVAIYIIKIFWHVTVSHRLSTTDREIFMGLLPCHCSPTNGDEKQRNHSTQQTHFCKEFGMFLRWLSAQKSWWLPQIGILPLGCLCC